MRKSVTAEDDLVKNIQFVKDGLDNNRLTAYTVCDRLLIQSVLWKNCSRLRILPAFDLMGVGPCSVQAVGVGSACLRVI